MAVVGALAGVLLLGATSCRRPAAVTDERAAIDGEFEELADGFDRSTGARQISVAELQRRLEVGGPVVLVDVREPREQRVSTLPGARTVSPDSVGAVDLEVDDDALVVTYCTAGYRSGIAAVALEKRLGRPVHNLHGGIIRWFNEGGEVVDPRGEPVDRIDPYSEEWARYVHPRGDGERGGGERGGGERGGGER